MMAAMPQARPLPMITGKGAAKGKAQTHTAAANSNAVNDGHKRRDTKDGPSPQEVLPLDEEERGYGTF